MPTYQKRIGYCKHPDYKHPEAFMTVTRSSSRRTSMSNEAPNSPPRLEDLLIRGKVYNPSPPVFYGSQASREDNILWYRQQYNEEHLSQA